MTEEFVVIRWKQPMYWGFVTIEALGLIMAAGLAWIAAPALIHGLTSGSPLSMAGAAVQLLLLLLLLAAVAVMLWVEAPLVLSRGRLVVGSDTPSGLTLATGHGRRSKATVQIPDGTHVTLSAVPLGRGPVAAAYSLVVDTSAGTQMLNVRVKPRAWDIAPATEHFARHGIEVTWTRPGRPASV